MRARAAAKFREAVAFGQTSKRGTDCYSLRQKLNSVIIYFRLSRGICKITLCYLSFEPPTIIFISVVKNSQNIYIFHQENEKWILKSWRIPAKTKAKSWNASRICVSSLRRGHANLLCIVPILVYAPPKWDT